MTYDEFWVEEFGNSMYARDFAGRRIERNCHGIDYQDSEYAWDVDHIMPQASGGSDNIRNLQIVNVQTNREKGAKTSFTANGKSFQIKRKSQRSPFDSVADYDYSDKDYIIVRL